MFIQSSLLPFHRFRFSFYSPRGKRFIEFINKRPVYNIVDWFSITVLLARFHSRHLRGLSINEGNKNGIRLMGVARFKIVGTRALEIEYL